jgi:hypothetical protein
VNAVVVGADRLGNIPDLLKEMGIQMARHISGRSSAHQRSLPALPRGTELLILFTDFLSHNAMRSYRAQAEAQGIRVLACRRSASCLVQAVGKTLGPSAGCNTCGLGQIGQVSN